MKKGLVVLFFHALIPCLCLAQDLKSQTDSVIEESGDYLIVSTGFQNKASFMSRDFGQNIPIFSSDQQIAFPERAPTSPTGTMHLVRTFLGRHRNSFTPTLRNACGTQKNCW
jgi:hypothetical protein